MALFVSSIEQDVGLGMAIEVLFEVIVPVLSLVVTLSVIMGVTSPSLRSFSAARQLKFETASFMSVRQSRGVAKLLECISCFWCSCFWSNTKQRIPWSSNARRSTWAPAHFLSMNEGVFMNENTF